MKTKTKTKIKAKAKKFLVMFPMVVTLGVGSIAFADDGNEHKEDRERAERKEERDRAERKEERAERKEERERAERKEERKEKEIKEQKAAEKKEEKEERKEKEEKEEKLAEKKEEKEEKKEKEKKEEKAAEKKEEKEEKAAERKEERERSERLASGDQNLYIGGLVGATKSANSDGIILGSETSPTFGLTAGIKLSPSFEIAFLATRYRTRSTSTDLGLPIGTDSNTTLLLGQGSFLMGGFHLGVEIGSSINSWDGKISSLNDGTSSTSTVYGPQGGIDFRLDKTLTLGGEVHYLFSTAKNVVSNVQALAVLKIWL